MIIILVFIIETTVNDIIEAENLESIFIGWTFKIGLIPQRFNRNKLRLFKRILCHISQEKDEYAEAVFSVEDCSCQSTFS